MRRSVRFRRRPSRSSASSPTRPAGSCRTSRSRAVSTRPSSRRLPTIRRWITSRGSTRSRGRHCIAPSGLRTSRRSSTRSPRQAQRYLNAAGQDGQWHLQLRFDERADFARFQTHIAEDGLSVDLHRLYNPTQPRAGATPGLMELQQETLIAALEASHYESPREVTMGELAEGIDVSQQCWPNGSGGDTII